MEDEQKKWVYWAIPVVVAVAIGAALYYGRSHRQAEQAKQEPAVTVPETPTPAEEPPVRNPLAETPPPKPFRRWLTAILHCRNHWAACLAARSIRSWCRRTSFGTRS